MDNQKYYNKKVSFYNLYKQNNLGNPLVLNVVSEEAVVFDIGCNTGNLAKGLTTLKNCDVYGVDISDEALKCAKPFLKDGRVLDLENFDRFPFTNKNFDYIILADVLEHIRNPKEVLEKINKQLKFKYLVISLPNVAFLKVRFNLVMGKFDYENHGIMDESHLHFYTQKTMVQMFTDCGYKVVDIRPFPLTNRKLAFITHPLTNLFPNLFGRQLVFRLKR